MGHEVLCVREQRASTGDRQPEFVAPGTAEQHRRIVQGFRTYLPGSGARPLQHDDHRGQVGPHHRRSADFFRDRGGRNGALSEAFRQPARRRRDLLALSRRSLWRRERRGQRSGCSRRKGEDLCARRLSGARRFGKRLCRHRDEPPGSIYVRRPASEEPDRTGRRRPGQDHLPRHRGPDRADRQHRRGRESSRTGHHRRAADRVPADAGNRSAGGNEHVHSRLSRARRRRERDAHPAQRADHPRRAGARPQRLVLLPRRHDRPLWRHHRGIVRAAPLADLGHRADFGHACRPAGHVPVHQRSDAAAHQPRLHADGNRRGTEDPSAGARQEVV